MQYDKMALGRMAKEMGYIRDTFEKVCRLADILKFFEEDALISEYLLLKGGTAINLTILELPRLSVDIDLDFSKNLPKEEMENIRRQICERIKKYMQANDYVLSPKSKYHAALDSMVYGYQNAGGNRDNLKIEINYMNRCHVLDPVRRKAYTPWRDDEVIVACVAPVEIYASKIVALFNRTAPRDLYDIHNMIRHNVIRNSDRDMLRKCVVFYSAIGAETVPHEFCYDNIADVSAQQIKTALRPVLRNGEKFDLQTVRREVTEYLTEILELDIDERLFWNSFKDKDYKPEYLYGRGSEYDRVLNHPMAQWKCRKT